MALEECDALRPVLEAHSAGPDHPARGRRLGKLVVVVEVRTGLLEQASSF